MFNLIILSTVRGEVSIIKANDTETTITLPLVEDLLTDSFVSRNSFIFYVPLVCILLLHWQVTWKKLAPVHKIVVLKHDQIFPMFCYKAILLIALYEMNIGELNLPLQLLK